MQTQEGRTSANDRSMVVSSYASPALIAGDRAAGPTPRIVNIQAPNSKVNPSSSLDLATLDVVNYQEPEGPKQPRLWRKHRNQKENMK